MKILFVCAIITSADRVIKKRVFLGLFSNILVDDGLSGFFPLHDAHKYLSVFYLPTEDWETRRNRQGTQPI